MTFEPFSILRVLQSHDVEFIVRGGIAAAVLGSPSSTVDLDICYRRDPGNLERLAAALEEMGARLRGTDDDVPFLLEAKTLAAGDHFTLSTDKGDLDILGTPAATAGFEDLAVRAEDVDLDGLNVRVCALDDLIRMKKAAGRPKDLIELEVLGALRDEVDEPG